VRFVVEFIVEAVHFVVWDNVKCFQWTKTKRIQGISEVFPTTLLGPYPQFPIKCQMLNSRELEALPCGREERLEMLRAEFRAEIDYVTGVVNVDFHRFVWKCKRKDEGVLSPAVAGCVEVLRVMIPGDVGAG
jgi:hypothetical protein